MTDGPGLDPGAVALLGLGEAGSAIAAGLCGEGGWRSGAPGREVVAIDIALGDGPRGRAMATNAEKPDLPIERNFTDALSACDLVISVVTGEEAASAVRMAGKWLRPGTL
ncbi:MAG: hypothetical protein CL569_10630 [Alphaproteobacteria bacterium]|nr:hypothetical protein [Alphaproteobacteria bacterium]|tara:strand:+ start:82 stop:411 length:330 start_codon:yes stop_codon:yes gene_type:complete